MSMDFETWMRAVWSSITDPSEMARKITGIAIPRDALWTALALIAVLNVILLGLLQMLAPADATLDQQAFVLPPFATTAIIGVFLVFLVFGTFQAGRLLGGTGDLTATLTVIVWFQAISLTLEIIQLLLLVISPAIASFFGMLSLAALIWCFVNFVNVLHGFDHIGKSILAIVMALVGTAFCAGILLAIFGISPTAGA